MLTAFSDARGVSSLDHSPPTRRPRRRASMRWRVRALRAAAAARAGRPRANRADRHGVRRGPRCGIGFVGESAGQRGRRRRGGGGRRRAAASQSSGPSHIDPCRASTRGARRARGACRALEARGRERGLEPVEAEGLKGLETLEGAEVERRHGRALT